MKAGDYVYHMPSREQWVIARVDGEDVYPAGWPCTIARKCDCILEEACSQEDHLHMVESCQKLPDGDPRKYQQKECNQ